MPYEIYAIRVPEELKEILERKIKDKDKIREKLWEVAKESLKPEEKLIIEFEEYEQKRKKLKREVNELEDKICRIVFGERRFALGKKKNQEKFDNLISGKEKSGDTTLNACIFIYKKKMKSYNAVSETYKNICEDLGKLKE